MTHEIRIGILDDMSELGEPPLVDITPWLDRAVDDLRAAGRIDREVTFVRAAGLGLPHGSAAEVERSFARLVEEEVLMIVGPAIGDNAIIATPLAEAARIPTLNWAGSERARSEWMFHLQVGSHEDESLVIARHMAALGARRLMVVADRSPIGRRHFDFLRDEVDVLGMEIAAFTQISPIARDARAEVARVLAGGGDGFVYLGLGLAAAPVGRALAEAGWQGPRMLNTAGLRGYDPAFARDIDGWHYVDMVSDDNRTLAGLYERYGLSRHAGGHASRGHDLGRLVAEAIARAPELTRAGLREGLERIKWLPAAEGHEGTLLGFGRHDRGALHGRYLVVRRWMDGVSVEAG